MKRSQQETVIWPYAITHMSTFAVEQASQRATAFTSVTGNDPALITINKMAARVMSVLVASAIVDKQSPASQHG